MTQRTILITGASGQVGGEALRLLADNPDLVVKGAVRSDAQADAVRRAGAEPVFLDYDDPATIAPAMDGLNGLLLISGYTVDMLKHAKRAIDAAVKAGVDHIVQVGASGADTAEIAHWGWHRMIQSYIMEVGARHGIRHTFLRPESYMQNLVNFGWLGEDSLVNLIGEARWSWVDARDVGAMAAAALADPDTFHGQVIRMGYDAATMAEVAAMAGKRTGHTVTLAPLDPGVFYEGAVANGADPFYMACVRDQFRLNAQDAIPEADRTFDADAFRAATRRAPYMLDDYLSDIVIAKAA